MPQTIEERVTILEQKVSEFEGSIGYLVTQVAGVHRRLINLEQQVNERFDGLEMRIGRLEEKIDRLEEKIFRQVDRLDSKIDQQGGSIIKAVSAVIKEEIAKLKDTP